VLQAVQLQRMENDVLCQETNALRERSDAQINARAANIVAQNEIKTLIEDRDTRAMPMLRRLNRVSLTSIMKNIV
jgi:hypothetical protein